jgi:hypothetical protein
MSASGGASGFVTGVLGLVGAGKLYDPLNDLRGQVSQARDRLQQLQNTENYIALVQETKNAGEMLKLLQSQRVTIDEHIEFYNNLALNDINKLSMFTTLLSLMVIVLVFFALV